MIRDYVQSVLVFSLVMSIDPIVTYSVHSSVLHKSQCGDFKPIFSRTPLKPLGTMLPKAVVGCSSTGFPAIASLHRRQYHKIIVIPDYYSLICSNTVNHDL